VLDIDWQLPWYTPWATYGEKVQLLWQETPGQLHLALNQFLTTQEKVAEVVSRSYAHVNSVQVDIKHKPAISFVPQPDLPAHKAYESFIFEQKQIPTRNNAHDFFNGLCWLRFPKTKSYLNLLQAESIAKEGVGAKRGALRDALTLFDENAALLCAPEPLWKALSDKHWHELFVTQTGGWREAQPVLFGHALLEKLLQPYKGITAHVLCLPMPVLRNDEEVDAWLCQQLTPEWLQAKPFTPLPLAGIPGWWHGNETPDFFEDKKVFRD
jgi:hypothetical protein